MCIKKLYIYGLFKSPTRRISKRERKSRKRKVHYNLVSTRFMVCNTFIINHLDHHVHNNVSNYLKKNIIIP